MLLVPRTQEVATVSCRGNVVAESWFSMLKNKMYYRRRFAACALAWFHVLQYIEVFYNRLFRFQSACRGLCVPGVGGECEAGLG